MKKRQWIKHRPKSRRYKKRIYWQRHLVGRRMKRHYGVFKYYSPFQEIQEGRDVLPVKHKILKPPLPPTKKQIIKRKERKKLFKKIEKQKDLSEKAQEAIELVKEQEAEDRLLEQKHKAMMDVADKYTKRINQATEQFKKQGVSPTGDQMKRALEEEQRLLTLDPKGRAVRFDKLMERAVKNIIEQDRPKFKDEDYINALEEKGYSKKDAKDLFEEFGEYAQEFRPKQFAETYEKWIDYDKTGEERQERIVSVDDVRRTFQKLLKLRPDLKKYNRIKIFTKLKQDLKETDASMQDLDAFFSMDKPLKESMESEKPTKEELEKEMPSVEELE